MVLAKAGAAVCVDEGPDFDAALAAALRSLVGEPERLAVMAGNFKEAGIPDGLKAAAALADLIEGK